MHVGLASIHHFSRYLGGNERYLHELALALINLDVKVTYITGEAHVPPQPYPVFSVPTRFFLGQPLPSFSWAYPHLQPPNLIHTSGSGLPLPLLFANIKPIARVHTFQARTHPHSVFGHLGAALEIHLIQSFCQEIIVTTPYYRQYLSQNMPSKNIHFIPLMLPSIFLESTPQFKRQAGQLLFVGTLDRHHYYKGLDLLLYTLQKLPASFSLYIVGGGALLPQYQLLSAKLGLSSRTHFTGRLNDNELIKLYRESQMLVQPSVSDAEGFGLCLLEAMSQNTPVITTHAAAGSSWLKSKNLAIIVKPNPKALSQAILNLSNTAASDRIQTAYNFAQSLSPQKIAQQTLNLYEKLL